MLSLFTKPLLLSSSILGNSLFILCKLIIEINYPISATSENKKKEQCRKSMWEFPHKQVV